MDQVFEHRHTAHESLARMGGRRHPDHAGLDPPDLVKHHPESGLQLQPAILRCKALAAWAPAAYLTNANLHAIRSEAALRLVEALRDDLRDFDSASGDQLQEEREGQANTLEEAMCHLHGLFAALCKRAIKVFWRRDY